ncbi:MAG: baseplate J/gp47 family protein [Xenococcus sp. (in: cyanobacteria)]
MPLELPDLDDRNYDDLVQEALSMIPTYTEKWTNHNPSDPGITLIEMFAYLTEMLLYRQNRVTEANRLMFLQLLREPDWLPKQNSQGEIDLQAEIKETITRVRDERYRAITPADFVELAFEADKELKLNIIARAHCLPRRNLYSENTLGEPVDKPGHVSIVVIPKSKEGENSPPQPNPDLIDIVKEYLEERRLIGTKIHVVGPRYLTISIRLTIHLKQDAEELDTRGKITAVLEKFFRPLPDPDNPQQSGWPFGRNVYVSEIYQLLDELEGVDYVEKTNKQDEVFFPSANANLINQQRLIRSDKEELSYIQLKPEELVDLNMKDSEIKFKSPRLSVNFTN